jgi:hypothetical protein
MTNTFESFLFMVKKLKVVPNGLFSKKKIIQKSELKTYTLITGPT